MAIAKCPIASRASIPRPLPVFLVMIGMVIAVVAVNSRVGLTWLPAPGIVLAPTGLSLMIAGYAHLRGARLLAEVSFYIGLWLALPIIGVQLSYLLQLANFPLRDDILADADAALGLHWIDWAHFMSARQWPNIVLQCAYLSCFWQPLVSVAIFAFIGPPVRNRELLTQMLVALLFTLGIATFVPAIGPVDAYGITTTPATVVRTLRDGSSGPLPYTGIIWFPSYHTVMALLFAYAHRSNRWALCLFGTLNGVMLLAVPYTGEHYFIDMVGGFLVAVATVALVRPCFRERINPSADPHGCTA